MTHTIYLVAIVESDVNEDNNDDEDDEVRHKITRRR